MIVIGATTLAMLTQVVSVIGWLVLLILFPFVVLVIQAVLVRVLGYTLEPATESGRIPLGE